MSETVPAALEAMDRFGVSLAILAPPPFPPDHASAYENVRRIYRLAAGR